jgi:ATP-dependent DNA helicase RecG
MDLQAAVALHETLQRDCFPDQPVALIHGRMKPGEKEAAIRAFEGHHVRIMVATTVIEVGVDLPDARLMVIEDADRFGLSQLHQLRGRVGRGAKQSYCILMKSKKCSPEAEARLKVMAQTHDGFVVAEKDLQIRGPGDLLGTRQSGEPYFRIGHPLRDIRLLSLAREEAKEILRQDPGLASPANRRLFEAGAARWKSFFS